MPNPRADACADDCTDVRAYARADAPRADDCDCADARDDPYADPYADPSRRRFSPHRYATYSSYAGYLYATGTLTTLTPTPTPTPSSAAPTATM